MALFGMLSATVGCAQQPLAAHYSTLAAEQAMAPQAQAVTPPVSAPIAQESSAAPQHVAPVEQQVGVGSKKGNKSATTTRSKALAKGGMNTSVAFKGIVIRHAAGGKAKSMTTTRRESLGKTGKLGVTTTRRGELGKTGTMTTTRRGELGKTAKANWNLWSHLLGS